MGQFHFAGLEWQQLSNEVWGNGITSVFFGGGTPSMASPLTIGDILDTVSQCTHLAEGTEITLEANPTSADASRLAEFQRAGVNRLSIGVQSLNDADLKLLGRNHTALEALRTLEEAKRLFPGHTSIDLIFGLPGQTVTSWVQSLQKLLPLCDDHVSLYQLTLERGTSLFTQVHQGYLPMPDMDAVAEMYDCARHILRDTGFHQYEVSNFARNGALSAHNLSYWQGSQYIGLGPGAHGRFVPWGDAKIQQEARIQTLEPDIWMKEVLAFGHGTRKRTALSELDRLEEVLMLGLRMDVGISHQHWLRFSPTFSLWNVFGESEEVKELKKQDLLFLDNSYLNLIFNLHLNVAFAPLHPVNWLGLLPTMTLVLHMGLVTADVRSELLDLHYLAYCQYLEKQVIE
ncbi:UNVERIFIED_CONTAM: radical S-adenosyl methionine domain-containing protein 1 [Gekko kuhli]